MSLKSIFKKLSSTTSDNDVITRIYPCTEGNIIKLSDVNDEVFSTGMMGKGFAIVPNDGKIIAPVDATVEMLFPTKHAIGLKTKSGAEILIHIGINTVELEGNGFNCDAKIGDKVKKGELLETIDLEYINTQNYDSTIMVIVTNTNQFKSIDWVENTLIIEK